MNEETQNDDIKALARIQKILAPFDPRQRVSILAYSIDREQRASAVAREQERQAAQAELQRIENEQAEQRSKATAEQPVTIAVSPQ
jgi:hypothetical protein